jgi:hypothetical protein
MWDALPYELALIVFDFAAADESRDARMAKALRRLNRECAMRYARTVWLIGARLHYLHYLRQLPIRPQREAVRLLIPRGWGGVMYAAQVAANAASAAMPHDEQLFALLSKCTKYRI